MSQTAAETRLWRALRGRRFRGLKWRRQHPVGPYIVDFFCRELRLAIEVDGAVHDATGERDRQRDEYLAGRGLRVVRVRNEDVLDRLEDLLAAVIDPESPLSGTERGAGG